jgi:DNA-binding NtrC family response regulator
MDIPVLAEYFLHLFFERLHSLANEHIEHVRGLTSAGTINPDFAAFLKRQKWTENVTELKAYLRSLIIPGYRGAFQEREKIEVMKMVLMVEEGNEFSLRRSIAVIENGIIDRALRKYEGRKTKAARIIGITERSVRRHSPLRMILLLFIFSSDFLSLGFSEMLSFLVEIC